MIIVCDTCRRRLVQFSLSNQGITMPSVNLSKIVLLITMYSCNILSLPVKTEAPDLAKRWLKEQSSLSAALMNSRYLNPPMAPVSDAKYSKFKSPGVKPCDRDISKIIFPLKYRHDDKLTEPRLDDSVHLVNLPIVKQPYENYKVLIATAPPGLELGEDSDKAMTVYIVFNDEKSYPSPLNLPTVYFVKKRPMSYHTKDLNPILLVDSNRTVTGLRSKEIEKFVKFSNKLINRI